MFNQYSRESQLRKTKIIHDFVHNLAIPGFADSEIEQRIPGSFNTSIQSHDQEPIEKMHKSWSSFFQLILWLLEFQSGFVFTWLQTETFGHVTASWFRGEQKADIWGPNLLDLLNQHGQACISKVFPFGAKGAGKEPLSKDAISVTWLLVVEICKVGYSRQLLCSFVEATQRSLYLFEFSVLRGFNVAFEGKWHISIQALSGVWWIGLRHVVHLKRASLKPRT